MSRKTPEVYFFHQLYSTPLAHTGGEVVHFIELPPILNQPLIKKEGGDILGLVSGGRCALVANETATRFFKIKGVNPTNKPMEGYYDPFGGQRYSSTRQELDNAGNLGNLFAEEGLRPGYNPAGYFLYDMKYTHPESKETEQLAGSIFEIYGDSRLGDLIGNLVTHEFWWRKLPLTGGRVWLFAGDLPPIPVGVYEAVTPEVKSVLEKFGVWVGHFKKLMDSHNYTWGSRASPTNAHIKNFVLLGEGDGERAEAISLAPVDLDSIKQWQEDKGAMRKLQEIEYHYLKDDGPTYWQQGFENGYRGQQPEKILTSELLDAGSSMEYLLTH